MRVVEHYTSIQGEGRHVGKPTQFIRFAGCNYKCAGWACDTQHAIDPKLYRELQKNQSPEIIVGNAAWQQGMHICLTGGEPMMQPMADLQKLVDMLISSLYTVEMFSNGSFLYATWLLANVDITMDWKLEGSGEGNKDIANRIINLEKMNRESTWGRHSVKFVCKHEEDLREALSVIKLHGIHEYGVNIYFGVVWGKWREADLVELLLRENLDYEWRLNTQLHNYIWPPNERGR